MKYTDKDLFEMALGYYTCNADEIVDDILENDDWSEVVIYAPFEYYEINDLSEEVNMLYDDFKAVRDGK